MKISSLWYFKSAALPVVGGILGIITKGTIKFMTAKNLGVIFIRMGTYYILRRILTMLWLQLYFFNCRTPYPYPFGSSDPTDMSLEISGSDV